MKNDKPIIPLPKEQPKPPAPPPPPTPPAPPKQPVSIVKIMVFFSWIKNLIKTTVCLW